MRKTRLGTLSAAPVFWLISLLALFAFAGCPGPIPADDPALASITVKTPPAKITYTLGEAFASAGLVVEARYDDDRTETVTADYALSWNGAALAEASTAISAEAGTKTVTVTYQGETATFNITVEAGNGPENKTLVSITVKTPPTKTTYTLDEAFAPAGLVVEAQYDDESAKPVTGYVLSWNGAALAEASTAISAEVGTKTVTVTYQGETATFNITVEAGNGPENKTLVSITVKTPPTKTTYTVGEAFASAGLVVEAQYDDESAETVTGYALWWNNAALADGNTAITAEAGTKTVTVSYQGKTGTFEITVNESPLVDTVIRIPNLGAGGPAATLTVPAGGSTATIAMDNYA
ncbi:MAG: bacterial Ig-like domain-containing protein, partial [Treponema sp.]|nr:bacterial Ig-like domain-containing protein [Treponema sp.]